MFCEVDKISRHPVYKARIQRLIEEFHETTDNQEWVNWQKKYSLWDADGLATNGTRIGRFVRAARIRPCMFIT